MVAILIGGICIEKNITKPASPNQSQPIEKPPKPTQNRKRNIIAKFRVTEEENAHITAKMAAAKIRNKEAYLRKMALDGYVLHLDFADVRELSNLLRNATNNLNQVARRANETRNIYASDIKDLQDNYDKLWEQAEAIMRKLAKL